MRQAHTLPGNAQSVDVSACQLRADRRRLGESRSDTDHCDFATGSPDEPFHADAVACENHGFLAKSRRHHNRINHIRRSGQAKQSPCFVRLALTKRNDRATSQEAPELGLFWRAADL